MDEGLVGYATLDDGTEGVIFVEKHVESMRSGKRLDSDVTSRKFEKLTRHSVPIARGL